jgi:hypothetical protein
MKIHSRSELSIIKAGNIITIGYQAMADSVSLALRGGV